MQAKIHRPHNFAVRHGTCVLALDDQLMERTIFIIQHWQSDSGYQKLNSNDECDSLKVMNSNMKFMNFMKNEILLVLHLRFSSRMAVNALNKFILPFCCICWSIRTCIAAELMWDAYFKNFSSNSLIFVWWTGAHIEYSAPSHSQNKSRYTFAIITLGSTAMIYS